MRAFLLLFFAALVTAQVKTETGDLNGASFRIDMPANWNGGLIMYCHGYAQKPVILDPKPNGIVDAFTNLGYAVAQSGYSMGGWAIKEATEDTEELRRYFLHKYGAVKETYITGHSMGGLLTMMIMERMAGAYKAGLALCGPLSATSDFTNRGAFDGLILFNYFFPGVLPDPGDIRNFQGWSGLRSKVEAALQSKPAEAETLRRFGGQKSLKDLGDVMIFNAGLVLEMNVRAEGQPFDNSGTVYTVEGDYNAVNDGVKRYAPDAKAAAYLSAWYTPTGRLTGPMLAIHTTYDPLVPTWIPNRYQAIARTAGSADLFVQQYVKHDGHCQITASETLAAFQELKRWADGGPKPSGGIVPVSK